MFYTKSIVDFLIAGAAERSGAMTRFIVWWITLVFLRAAMGSFLMLVQGNLAEKIVERANVDVMRKAASFTDLRPYEDPAFYDTMNVLWLGIICHRTPSIFYVENVSRIVERRS